MSDEDGEVYCICRSTDVSRFMIGCDKCEEWYHGDCINVTEEDARVIKKFFCKMCRDKNPGLRIRYKTSKIINKSSDKVNKVGKDIEKTEKTKKKEDKPKESKGSAVKPAAPKPSEVKPLAGHSKKEKTGKEEKGTKEEKEKGNKEEKAKDPRKDRHVETKAKDVPSSKEGHEKQKTASFGDGKSSFDSSKEKHKSKDKKLKDENRKEKKAVKEKVKEKPTEISSVSKTKENHKENKLDQEIKVKKKEKHKDKHKEKPEKSIKEIKRKDKPHKQELNSVVKSTVDVLSSGSNASLKSTAPKVPVSVATEKPKPTPPNSVKNSNEDVVRGAIKDVISNDKSRGQLSSILEKSLPRPKSTTSHSDSVQSITNKSSIVQSVHSTSIASIPKISSNVHSKASNNHVSHKSSGSSLLSKHLSVDLNDVLAAGSKCGQCEACRVTQDCMVCSQCRSGDKRLPCVNRRCSNLRIKTPPTPTQRPQPPPPPEVTAPLDVRPPPPAPPVRLAAKLPRNDPVWQSSGDESDERPRSVLKDRNDRCSDDDVWEPARKIWEQPASKPKTKLKKKKTLPGGRGGGVAGGGGRKRKADEACADSDGEDGGVGSPFGPKSQCQGPGCINPARPHSKYCCDECGLNLAQSRIFAILPQRISEWKLSRCYAETQDIKKLEKIRKQQIQAHTELQLLEHKGQELERVVEKGLQLAVDPQADEEIEEDGGEGQGVYCVTCGHEVATRRAVKHMENCFNKMESQTTFGSQYKTRLENNNMFCDFYSASTRTYCKRLRVMCPEHYKEPKVPETRVCGAPLLRGLFEESGELCRVSRKRCMKHYRWERLRRAEIDMERVRQWMKLDELVEQERVVLQSMKNRAGVLGLMLHSAFDHTLASRFEQMQLQQREREQQRQQQQQQQQQLQQQQLQIQQEQQQQQQQHGSQVDQTRSNDRLSQDGGGPRSQQTVHSQQALPMQPQAVLATQGQQKLQTITIPKFRLIGPQQQQKLGPQTNITQVVRVQLRAPHPPQLTTIRPRLQLQPPQVIIQQQSQLPRVADQLQHATLHRPTLQITSQHVQQLQQSQPPKQQSPLQQLQQPQQLQQQPTSMQHSDHRYFQNPAKVTSAPNTVTLVRRSDHIYYRPPASNPTGAPHLKLKVTQHKTTTPPNQKKVIHLQKSASGSLYLQTPTAQSSARFGSSVPRPPHEDHQYHSGGTPAPQPRYLRPPAPPPPPPHRSDHLYFNSKPARPSK